MPNDHTPTPVPRPLAVLKAQPPEPAITPEGADTPVGRMAMPAGMNTSLDRWSAAQSRAEAYAHAGNTKRAYKATARTSSLGAPH